MRMKGILIAAAAMAAVLPSAAMAQTQKFGGWSLMQDKDSCTAFYGANGQLLMMLASTKVSAIAITNGNSRAEKEGAEFTAKAIFGSADMSTDAQVSTMKLTDNTVSYFVPFKAEILAKVLKLQQNFYGERNGTRIWAFEFPQSDTNAAMDAFIACQAKLPAA